MNIFNVMRGFYFVSKSIAFSVSPTSKGIRRCMHVGEVCAGEETLPLHLR